MIIYYQIAWTECIHAYSECPHQQFIYGEQALHKPMQGCVPWDLNNFRSDAAQHSIQSTKCGCVKVNLIIHIH